MNYSVVDFNAIFQRFRKYETEKSKLIEMLKKEHQKYINRIGYETCKAYANDTRPQTPCKVCQYLKELGE